MNQAGVRRAMGSPLVLGGLVVFTVGALSLYAAKDPPWQSGIPWPKPPVVDPGPPGGPPSDAIVLFNGKDLSAWTGADKWKIEDGAAVCAGEIATKQPFGDCQLHVEWMEPTTVTGSSQQRGNSGIYIMSYYEVQILDNYENETYYDGQAAAMYKQHPPLVNACRKPGEWQTYDIIFRGPRFDPAGKLLKPAFITLLHNGVLVQDHFQILGQSNYRKPPLYAPHPVKLPLKIQYHGTPVHFRNIWIRELPEPDDQVLAPLRARLQAAAATKPS